MHDHRGTLGTALIARADDVAVAVLATLWPPGSPDGSSAVRDAIAEADRVGTRLIGRWLTAGAHVSEEERRQLGSLGGMIDEVTLDVLVKAYLAWRDAFFAVLEEEAARLGTPPDLVAEVRAVASRNNEGSMVRMARSFEEERHALRLELEAERAKLADLALHDGLTGLPNRILLFDRIEHALRVASRNEGALAIFFVDLDGFKAINDRFGHDVGDQLLVAVSARLCEAVRDSDTVARLGGDEFVVVCEGLDDMPHLTVVAERMISSLSRPFPLDGGEVSISASVGIAAAGGGDDPRDLLLRADVAMYAAKQCGPGRHETAKLTQRPAASARTVKPSRRAPRRANTRP
jgi:diguanylate cyclase (GGDEF)-like protein